MSLARGMGLEGEDALDCVQDAFCTFLDLPAAQHLRDEEETVKMLTVVVRNVVLNRRRSIRRRRRILYEQLAPIDATAPPSVDDTLASLEDLARLRGCLLRRRELQQRVVPASI